MRDVEMKGFSLVCRFPVHWGEMDALGHVNNTRYFAWFETARIAYFGRLGLTTDPSRGVGPILATTTCDFIRPLTYPADLVAGARVPRVGNTSFVMEYAVALASAPDDPVARGSGVLVLLDYGTGKKVAVSEEMRATIARIENRVG